MMNYVNNVIIHAETITDLLSVYPVDKEQVLGHIECCLVPQQVVDKHIECCSVPQQQVVYLPNAVQFLNNIPMSSYIIANAPTITVFMTMSW